MKNSERIVCHRCQATMRLPISRLNALLLSYWRLLGAKPRHRINSFKFHVSLSARQELSSFLLRRSNESFGANQQSLCCSLSRQTDFCDTLLHSTFGILVNVARLSGHHHCGRSSRVDSIVH